MGLIQNKQDYNEATCYPVQIWAIKVFQIVFEQRWSSMALKKISYSHTGNTYRWKKMPLLVSWDLFTIRKITVVIVTSIKILF